MKCKYLFILFLFACTQKEQPEETVPVEPAYYVEVVQKERRQWRYETDSNYLYNCTDKLLKCKGYAQKVKVIRYKAYSVTLYGNPINNRDTVTLNIYFESTLLKSKRITKPDFVSWQF